MVVNDIVNSCAHEKVAEAALASIGTQFLADVRAAARCKSQSPGAYAAASVSQFRSRAQLNDYAELHSAIRGADQPVLKGLRLILERRLAQEARCAAC